MTTNGTPQTFNRGVVPIEKARFIRPDDVGLTNQALD